MISNYKVRKKFTSKSPLLRFAGPKTSYNFYKPSMQIAQASPLASKRKGLSLKQSQLPPSSQLNPSKFHSSKSKPKPKLKSFKAKIRPSSQISNRIFDSSVYLTDPIIQGPIEFEVELPSHQLTQGERYSSLGSSFEAIYSTFQTESYDNEKWLKNKKSPFSKIINLEKFRETQNLAAAAIQACWRGFRCRKMIREAREKKEKDEILRAEAKARRAIQEYEELKVQMMKLRKKQVRS